MITATTPSYVSVLGRVRSYAEFEEMMLLGMIDESGTLQPPPQPHSNRVPRAPMTSLDILNEAYDYEKPSSFTRGLRVEMTGASTLYVSGTASIDGAGVTVHVGDLRAQLWRTYRNISRLLESEGANWHDIVRTSCYLRDIERDYKDFNEVRTEFFNWLKLDPLPASTGIQVRLCREDLLVEIEAIAALPNNRQGFLQDAFIS